MGYWCQKALTEKSALIRLQCQRGPLRLLEGGRGCSMTQAGPYLNAGETRRALAGLLKRGGVECADEDLLVMTRETRRGDPIHVVIALNSAETPLANLIRGIAARRNAAVGVHGVFVLRPDDVRQLVSKIRA